MMFPPLSYLNETLHYRRHFPTTCIRGRRTNCRLDAISGAVTLRQRQACFLHGAFGPTFGVNNEPATMDRLIPRFVTFPQAAKAYTTPRQPVTRRDQQEPS
jgi:hypothetical protein